MEKHATNTEMNFGILASGHLGYSCVTSLWQKGIKPYFLCSDRSSSALISFAKENNLPMFVGNPRNGRGVSALTKLNVVPDLIVSINYLFLLDDDFIQFPVYGCINFHGSLLPRYRGRTPHVWAIINNEVKTGMTAHFIDKGCDTGPIILQHEIEIEPDHTGGDLLALYEREYPHLVEKTIRLFSNGNVPQGTLQDETKATYYGKRIPDDGLICWDWQRERIYNWVRAQAAPYPGAFCFYDEEKIIIDKIEFADHGYHFETANGTILESGLHPTVKTPNGSIRILTTRKSCIFEKGKVLI